MGFQLALCLVAPAASRAADSAPPADAPPPSVTPSPAAPPAVIASLQLKDGRLLHNVKVMSNEGASIVVKSDEGLLKIAKSNLPQTLADAYPAKPAIPSGPDLVMQPFNPDKAIMDIAQEPAAPVKPEPKPSPTPRPAGGGPVYKGCSILSFQMRSFQTSLGCAEVVIRNDTDSAAEVRPGDFVCLTTTGERHAGRAIVTADAFPPAIKRREFVPPHTDLTDTIIFSNEALEISTVQWAR